MANDVNQQLSTDLQKASCYSMCLDESTDINNRARLAVILRYAVGDSMREELVKLISLPGRTQGVDIYNAVMECFLTQSIKPEKTVSITSDGAPYFISHFNALNTKLQGVGKTAERMFCDIKAFERKLQVF
ncbi:zinc finger BED domain-containing protein 5-like [Tachypleus tridentatus]|uniref:zinc finger BED domain-containing protein 5-like n=1 Tax=Tachypleus tridentatus TaxID=6853 RepID=UPI003FD4E9C2